MKNENVSIEEDIRANVNYEQLLGRAVDRVLFQRINSVSGFYSSVYALDMALVDLPGKPLRSDFDKELEKLGLEYPSYDYSKEGMAVTEKVFKLITKILSYHSMLFRSTPVETNL